ncbi:MAG TPA: hypothetical protein VEB19_09890 [Gemmatimonadaceae bacterium]|nr:hypothetical protein [Gemmatimonadaceae bacterium]
MKQWLAPAHLALTLVIVVWNVILAGRIAQLRQATRPFATITGMAGMLLIPAFIVAIATTTVITGRGISAIDWLWPVTIVLFAGQSVYALTRKLVNPLWGYPIAFYNVFLAVAAVTRLFAAHGYDVARPLLVVMAAQIDALALATTEAAITSPFFLHVPIISPAFPALSRLTAGFRMAMAGLALSWFALMLAELPRADVALQSYDAHAGDRLTERPRGFSVGLKLFPDIAEAPSAASVKSDLETAVFTGVDVVNVVFAPGATQLAIDSVSHALDQLPRDSLVVIATIGYQGKLLPEIGSASLDVDQRLRTIRRVVDRLRPDILIPAQDPYGVGARILGRLSVETWQEYHTRAAAIVKEMRPRTRVAYTAAAFDSRDSTMYAWAAQRGSPIDVLGFGFYPTRQGARSIDAGFRAADRWLRAHPATKPHWVFGAGGYPLAHGQPSQDRAVWAALAWATSHSEIRGAVVTEAGDYGQAMGVRAPNGDYRLASGSVRRAFRAIRESIIQPAAPAPTQAPNTGR